jgi:uncharacterized protein (TIGR01777 family)
MKNETILIAGGSGLVGSALKKHLEEQQNNVIILTRNKALANKVGYAFWSPGKNIIDESVFLKSTILINLSGANIATRWTNTNKANILLSRTTAASFLANTCSRLNKQFKHIVCASAIGLYPQTSTCQVIYDESSLAGNGFLSDTVKSWELANSELSAFGSFTQLRIGIVLSTNGGMLQSIIPLFSKRLGSVIGSGEQGISWIHITDLIRMIDYVASNKIQGTFNAVAPKPVSQRLLAKQLASQMQKPILLPPIPGWLLRLALGEQAMLATQGAYVSSEKIRTYEFEFDFETLDLALKNILNENLG